MSEIMLIQVFMNSTSEFYSGMNMGSNFSSGASLALLAIVLFCAAIFGAFTLSSLQRYKNFLMFIDKLGGRLFKVILYFIEGLATIVVLLVSYWIVKTGMETAGSLQIDPVLVTEIIAGFIGVTLLGFVMSKIGHAVKVRITDYNKTLGVKSPITFSPPTGGNQP